MTEIDTTQTDENLLDYAMAIAHERELDVLGHKHDSDGTVRRFNAAVERFKARANGANIHVELNRLGMMAQTAMSQDAGDVRNIMEELAARLLAMAGGASVASAPGAARHAHRVLKTDCDHANAIARLSELMDMDPASGSAEGAEMELLVLLIQSYEQNKFPPSSANPATHDFCPRGSNEGERDPIRTPGGFMQRCSNNDGQHMSGNRSTALAGAPESDEEAHSYLPNEIAVREACDLLGKIKNSHSHWGGWSSIPSVCDEAIGLLRCSGTNVEPQASEASAPVTDERAAGGYVPSHDQPHQTGVGEWCAPGPATEQRQTWLLRFADADRGDCVYYEEHDARRAFAQAEGRGWNCYLLQYARRVAIASIDERVAFEKLVGLLAPNANLLWNSEFDSYRDKGLQAAWRLYSYAQARTAQSTAPLPKSKRAPLNDWRVQAIAECLEAEWDEMSPDLAEVNARIIVGYLIEHEKESEQIEARHATEPVDPVVQAARNFRTSSPVAGEAQPFAVLAVHKNGEIRSYSTGQALKDAPIQDSERELQRKYGYELVTVYATPQANIISAPTESDAEAMGRKGASHSEAERKLYEAYCRGHCWAVGPWLADEGYYSEMTDRIRFAMWRDRAALALAPGLRDGTPHDR